MFSRKFDIVVGLGPNCACAMYLRNVLLRDFSGPFDWIGLTPFEKKVELLLNHFKDFLEFDYMVFSPDAHVRGGSEKFDCYIDQKSGHIFVHDFKRGVPLEKSFPEIKEKYNRRIKRLYDSIAKYDNALFVWWSKHEKDRVDDSVLLESQKKLSTFFGKDICILVFEQDKSASKPYERKISESVIKYVADLAGDDDNLLGDEKVSLAEFMKIRKEGIRLLRFKESMKKYLIRIVCGFIFVPTYRKRCRQYLRERLYR